MIAKNEFKGWDYSNPRALECKNHPECKYYWKGPGRNLHRAGAAMLVDECSCPISDLMVLEDGESWTTTTKIDIGSWNLSMSGPRFKYAVKLGIWTIATFEADAEEFATEYVDSIKDKYQEGQVQIELI